MFTFADQILLPSRCLLSSFISIVYHIVNYQHYRRCTVKKLTNLRAGFDCNEHRQGVNIEYITKVLWSAHSKPPIPFLRSYQ